MSAGQMAWAVSIDFRKTIACLDKVTLKIEMNGSRVHWANMSDDRGLHGKDSNTLR